jgi:hypothetical protein
MTRRPVPADPWARWETPRAIALVVVITAALFGTVAGLAGYVLGTTPPQVVFQPGAIQVPLEMAR